MGIPPIGLLNITETIVCGIEIFRIGINANPAYAVTVKDFDMHSNAVISGKAVVRKLMDRK